MTGAGGGIAIVGMACTFPGAPDLDAFLLNLRDGRDATSDVPATRWEPVFHDPASRETDRFACRRGGFISEDLRLDPAAAGLMPIAAEGAEPDQLLALDVAMRALADAGGDDARWPRERTAVILGRGGYLGAGVARVDQHVRTSQQLVECLRGLLPGLGEDALEAVRREFHARLPHYGPDTAIGLVPNLAASRIANRLDLRGAAFTVDAACASSLVAVDQACRELRDGRADLALAGGIHLCHDVTFWSVFTQLGALSRSGRSRPFHRDADGLLIGEGAGIVVLEREEDARAAGRRIYAIVRGIGISSDGRGTSPMQPRSEGQALALRRGWESSGIDPASIGLLEAHGTATPAGDRAELAALASFFGRDLPERPGIGSVKSMIGHAMPAAGAAGLIKAALAIHHGLRLPTLHCDDPHELMSATGFRPTAVTEPWEARHRVAAVSAFGFGGINAHVVLDGDAAVAPMRRAKPRAESCAADILLLAAASGDDLLTRLDLSETDAGDGPARLAVAEPTPERLRRAREIVAQGRARASDREGIWFSPRGLIATGGRVAWIFPGLDAGFEPDVDDLARDLRLPQPPPAGGATDLGSRGRAVVGSSVVLAAALRDLGLEPDVVAGHSIGEWTAMTAAGMVPRETLDALLASPETAALEVPGVGFAAAGCGLDRAVDALQGLDDVAVSHDNCPHQVILCGRQDSLDAALQRLRAAAVPCEALPFRSGFHSEAFAPFLEPHRRFLAGVRIEKPRVPMWSATTCRPFPDDPAAIRELALRHLVRPVRFRELLLELHDAGVRVFVEAGGGRLASFVEDTLRDRPHAAVRTAVPRRSGRDQVHRAAARLWVEGAAIRTERMAPAAARPPGMRLRLGPALVSMAGASGLIPAAAAPAARHAAAAPADPLLAALDENMRVLQSAHEEIARALQASRGDVASSARAELSRMIVVSLESFPQLLDHCFYRQPAGWPSDADRFPVLPLTSAIALMMRHAAELVPGRVVWAVERVRALRWIAAAPPTELALEARFDGEARVDVTMGDHASASFVFASERPMPPPPAPDLAAASRAAPIDAAELYSGRWMFHGERFQGIRELGPVSAAGIRGVIEALPTEGALLDAAGQLFGYWIMLHAERDRLAFPARIDRIEYFGADPAPGDRVACCVRIASLDEQRVRADIELVHAGRTWARVVGWEDRRFGTDERLWATLRHPEREAFAEPRDGGWCVARDTWRNPASQDLIARRYLGESELAEYEAQGPHRRAWLLGHMAAKDAVRRRLWAAGAGDVFPVEVTLRQDAPGQLHVLGAGAGLVVAFDADEKLGVALVAGRAGAAIAIREIDADADAARRDAADRVSPGGGRGVATAIEGRHAVAWVTEDERA